MKRASTVILIIIAVIVLSGLTCGGWVVSNYNKVIALREATRSQWAQVETQLQRRYDLIPNLVEAVKGYAKHERGLFEHIADARKAYFQAKGIHERIQASQRLEGALSRLLVLVERYPELKANESFLKLQDSLEGTENRIAVARRRYNESVRELNTYIQSFFGRFIASLAGVGPAEYFEAPQQAKEVPKVKF